MFVVTVEFVVKKSQEQAFLREMVANARTTRERERGCRQFDVSVAHPSQGEIFLYEIYDDRAAFDAHLASAHFKAFDAAVAPWVDKKTVRIFERVYPS